MMDMPNDQHAPDALDLAQALIRCPSVTPQDEGALDCLQSALEEIGFACRRLSFEGDGSTRIDNLYARLGTKRPLLMFAGHTDVVPVGDADAWSVDPFAGEVRDGDLIGRGANDMKSAIACFVAAVKRHLSDVGTPDGSIALLITGDEEGDAVNGTKKMLDALSAEGEEFDHCITGEPTNPHELGTMMKIGRRGSLTGYLTAYGKQGHTGYPHLADNAAHRMVRLLDALLGITLDGGSEHFEPSVLSITTVDIGNTATNVVPAKANATFNIRFNDNHSGASLEAMLRETLEEAAGGADMMDLRVKVSGESFLTPPGLLSDLIADACEEEIGQRPELSTTGGTSDSRFIKNFCPVVDFGLVGRTMHQVDERTSLSDMAALTNIYARVIRRYFEKTA